MPQKKRNQKRKTAETNDRRSQKLPEKSRDRFPVKKSVTNKVGISSKGKRPRDFAKGKTESASTSFPIVGIGASAGGLEAIGQLLAELPANTGMAFIIVQHLDPTHESMTAEILSRKTKMSVAEVTEGITVEANHIYVIPPNHNLVIKLGELRLSPRTEVRGQHLPINSFFQSLAEDQTHKAIGVILSGTASDGTLGLEAIKVEGGVTIVQDPKTAKFEGMPKSAIESGVVDLVLSPAKIAEELVRIAQHPLLLCGYEPETEQFSKDPSTPESAENAFAGILNLLKERCHVDFALYKHSTLKRRIARRMILHKIDAVEEYGHYLQTRADEVKSLFADMLINVTEFFRDPEAFAELKTQVFPQITKNRNPSATIRIWSVGCASGEEAYSLAMSVLEYLGSTPVKFPVQIFATDISESAIQRARSGLFPDSIIQKISKERLQRFFSKTDSGYRVDKSVRDMCLFSRHDVTRDPPFAKLDLICCRNVLIYFESALQKHVLPIFHYALNPGGVLWLGRSETVGGSASFFSPIDKVHKFYSRKAVAIAPRFHFPRAASIPEFFPKKPEGPASAEVDIQRETERINANRYAPPGIVVNDDGEIVLTRGDTSPYLQISPGVPSLNLFKMIRPELVSDVRIALQTARKQSVSVRKDLLEVRDGKNQQIFNLDVIPVRPGANSNAKFYLINFEKAPGAIERSSPRSSGNKNRQAPTCGIEQHAIKLEQELAAAKVYQQTTAEDFEATQEELTSANEELQTTIEEFQSTNEELETAKEELQSVNEELTTVNDELQTRNVDLNTLNNDLSNFMECGQIPMVMLDANGQIRKFTAQAGALLNLVSSDVGRPLGDIKPMFELPDLLGLVAEVIKSAVSKNIEVQHLKGEWYRLQIKPYKTMENRIDGAVISVVDIDLLRRHLNASEKGLEYAMSVANTVQLPLAVIDAEMRLKSANATFYSMFGLTEKDAGTGIISIVTTPDSCEPLQRALSALRGSKKAFSKLEIECTFPRLGRRILNFGADPIMRLEASAEEPVVLLSIEDITERRRTEDNFRAAESRFRSLVDSAHDSIISVDGKGNIAFANKQTGTLFGYADGELVGKPLTLLVPERYHARHAIDHKNYLLDPSPRPMGTGRELFARHKNGTEIPVDISLSPNKTFDGVLVTAIVRNISDRKVIENERDLLFVREQSARSDAERANQTKDAFLAMLSHELRTPLTAILSWSQMIQQNKMEPDKLKMGLETIERNAKLQGQLIDDLLDIARIQSGKLALNVSNINPADAVQEAVSSVALMAENKSIKIETVIDDKIGQVAADPQRLQQIVWNLLTNAIKFSLKGQSISVKVESIENQSGRSVSIKVIDRGKGMKPEFLPKVFQRFTQADTSAARLHGGLGLGLSIVRDLVHLQNGTAAVESAGVNQGSTFTILLPERSDAATPGVQVEKNLLSAQSEDPKLAERPNLVGLSVLIVEDDASSLAALSETLESFGAKTIRCKSAADAKASFETSKADVLISDIAMPGEDGYSLMRKIRALGPDLGGNIPSLALTAYAAREDVNLTNSAGFDAHMAKPYDILRLARTVEQLAQKKRG